MILLDDSVSLKFVLLPIVGQWKKVVAITCFPSVAPQQHLFICWMKRLQKHMLVLLKTSKLALLNLDLEKFFVNFEKRRLCQDEYLSFFWPLKDILSKADPDLTDAAREILLSHQFMKGLPS